MSIPQDGYPPRGTNPPGFSSSQPESPSSSTSRHTHGVQTAPPARQSASSAITGGAERLLALFQDQMARVEAQHRKQMDELTARFDEFRYFAAQEQLKLVDRIYLLEAELAARGVYVDVADGGRTRIVGGTNHQGDTAPDTEILDPDTIHLVRDLARLVKGGATRTQGRMENLTFDMRYLPELFLPIFAQYLASHKKALHDLQENNRHRAVEREQMTVIPFAPQPSIPRNMIGPVPAPVPAPAPVASSSSAFRIHPSLTRETSKIDNNQLGAAASSSFSTSGGNPKEKRRRM